MTRPVREMSRLAKLVSMGKDTAEDEFDRRGTDEIAELAQSFTLMRRALIRARAGDEDQGSLSSQHGEQK